MFAKFIARNYFVDSRTRWKFFFSVEAEGENRYGMWEGSRMSLSGFGNLTSLIGVSHAKLCLRLWLMLKGFDTFLESIFWPKSLEIWQDFSIFWMEVAIEDLMLRLLANIQFTNFHLQGLHQSRGKYKFEPTS